MLRSIITIVIQQLFNYIFYSEQDPQSRKLCIYHSFEIGAINIEVSFVVPTYHIYKVFYDDAYTALGVIILKKRFISK